MRVSSDAGGFVEERHHVSAEYEIVGVYVGGVNDVTSFYLRLLDCLCVFHAQKINNASGLLSCEFLYSVHYGRKKDL